MLSKGEDTFYDFSTYKQEKEIVDKKYYNDVIKLEKEFKVKMEKLNADHKNSIKKIDKRLQQYVKKLEEKNAKSKRALSNLKN